jgi:hypothetical protein
MNRRRRLTTFRWRVLLILSMQLGGCRHDRPDFLTRVREDCIAGDKWACDLLDSLDGDGTPAVRGSVPPAQGTRPRDPDPVPRPSKSERT